MFRSIIVLLMAFIFTFPINAQEIVTPKESEKIITDFFEIMYGDSSMDYRQTAFLKFISPTELSSYKKEYPEFNINELGGADYKIMKNDGERVEVYAKTLRAQEWEMKCVFKIIKVNNVVYLAVRFRPDWIDPWIKYDNLGK